jgi:L-ascorbate metabolism protein UlaG (beta-lactamase superfamily)
MKVKVPSRGKFYFTLNPGSVLLKCFVHIEEEVENVGDVGKDTMLAFESEACKVKTKGVVCVEPPSVKAVKPWPSELVGTTGNPADEFTGVELDVTCVESNGTSYTGTYGSPLATLTALLFGPRLEFLGGSTSHSLSGPGSKTLAVEAGDAKLKTRFGNENHVHLIM